MHDLPNLPHCIIAPTASMHDHVICMFMVKQENIRENPNLAC